MKLLINSLVLPYFNYCSEVWSSASKTCLKRLARQFKKSQDLRGKTCDQKENSLLENIKKNIAIMTFKGLNDLTPVYLKQCFQYSSDVHRYNTRSAKRERLHVSQNSNTWQSRTFKAREYGILNALATKITKLNSLLLFKTSF